jgi:hypothetical protein
VIDTFGLKREGPIEGVYAAPPGYALRVLVLSELPKTRATLLLRLGSKKSRAPAIREVMALSPGDWERKVAEPLLVQYSFLVREGPASEESMLASEIRKRGEEIIQQAREEGERNGRLQGEREGELRILLRLLRRRFGELSQEVLARLESAGPDQLERWSDRVLTAPSLDEVLGAT